MERELGQDFDLVDDGFDESLARAANALRGAALRATGHPDEAADLLQDTLLSALESRDRFDRERGELLPWLLGVLSNHIRRRHRRLATPVLQALEDVPAPAADDPVERRELQGALAAALDQLPADSRRLLDLRLRDGLNSSEISGVLGIPASTVRTRLERIVKRLRKQLPPTVQVVALAYLASCSARPGPPAPPPPNQAYPSSRMLAFAAMAVVVLVGAWLWVADSVGDALPSVVPSPQPARAAATASEPNANGENEPPRVPLAETRDELGEVVLRAVWEATGEPAAGISLRLLAPDVPGIPGVRLGLAWREVRLDDHGEARFEDVPLGPACVFADDGLIRVHEATVRPGRQTWQASLRPVCVFRGQVVDHAGEPVADAEVWTSSTGGSGTPGVAAARTAEDGSFEAAAFHATPSLWATSAGRAMSRLLRGNTNLPAQQVRLELGQRAVALRGRLVDDRGNVLPGGLVCVRNCSAAGLDQIVYATSDPGGDFELTGLHAGLHVIAAVAKQHAPVWQEVQLTYGTPQELSLVLHSGATIEGQILGAGDVPYDQLRVLAFRHDSLAVRMGILIAASAVDAAGRYRITDAPTGRIVVQAIHLGGLRHAPVASTDCVASGGQTVRADTVVGASSYLEGTVVDEGGAPLADLPIEAREERDRQFSMDLAFSGCSGSRGQFRIPIVGRGPFHCYVFSPSASAGVPRVPVAVGRGVVPGQPVTIRIARQSAPSALVGSVVDENGLVPAGTHVTLVLVDHNWIVSRPIDPTTGEFAFEPLPPNTYTVAIAQASRGRFAGVPLGPVSLRPGQRHDFGQVQLSGVGELRLRAEPPGRRQAWIHDLFDHEVWLEPGVDQHLSLRAGEHELHYLDGDCRRHILRFHIDAGACTEIGVPLQPARPCRLVFPVDRKASSMPIGRLWIELTDDQNTRLVLYHPFEPYDIPLRPGVYRVEARDTLGRTGAHALEVESAGPEVLEVSIPLR